MHLVVAVSLLLGQNAEQVLLRNASFEEGNDSPLDWSTQVWGGDAEFVYESAGREGGRSAAIVSRTGADASWKATVQVRPFATYRLSGWIQTEDVAPSNGKGALLNIHGLQPAQTPPVIGTQDWKQVEVVFETGDTDTLQVNCLLGGWGMATGKARFDDLRLDLVSYQELKPSVMLDAAQTGAPISEYVYGQFIEHLGRCIYGGIWAEMLEDRKFFHPVGAEESPWRVLEGGQVRMDAESAYVGEHTPEIEAGGIAHGGLGLIKGREYVGRIVLRSDAGGASVSVSLVWGSAPEERQTFRIEDVPADYSTTQFRFEAGADVPEGRLEIDVNGQGPVWVGTVSLMPADNVHGMRADTLALLRELDAPIYRWPGGNFVSGYDWRDGIGDPDRRPPRKNPAWKGVEHNDFGLDEFVVFCREIDTEPLIVVNSGLGDVSMALNELEYANGSPDSPMGKLRALNGHAEPYNVIWWGIGNEMYGDWQLGHMPLDEYVKKHNTYAEAMRAQVPAIKLVAVGATGPWSETMLRDCADHMDMLSEHFYCGAQPGLYSHVRQIPDNVRHKAEAHRRYHREIPSLKDKSIPIALDEWNYWYGPDLFGEIGVRYFLRDALGIAAGIHEMARNSDLFGMANYAQTVNVIGAIKTSKTAAAFETTGLVLKLYRHEYGVLPIQVTGAATPLDVAAAWTADNNAITVGVVNPTNGPFDLDIEMRGANPQGKGRRWQIAGSDPMLFNEPGVTPAVTIEEVSLEPFSGRLAVAPISVTIFRYDVK